MTLPLYIPGWPYDYFDSVAGFYKCKMKWNEADRDEAIEAYNKLYDGLRRIADLERNTRQMIQLMSMATTCWRTSWK